MGRRFSWQRAKRYGVIDVGTNSTLLLMVEAVPATHECIVLFDGVEITQLGKGFYGARRLQPDAMERTLETIRRFCGECDRAETDDLVVTGTSVLRDAENGGEFLDRVRSELGVEIDVISGEEEARLSYLSVRRDGSLPIPAGAPCLVNDIGGGSAELIIGDDKIRRMASLDIGAVRLTETCFAHDPPTPAELAAARERLVEAFVAAPSPEPRAALIGVGGTITTLANIAAHQRHPPPPMHGFRLTREKLREEIDLFASRTTAERESIPGLHPKRAGVILAGALIAERVMLHYGHDEYLTSMTGLRYGTLFDRFLNDGESWTPVAGG